MASSWPPFTSTDEGSAKTLVLGLGNDILSDDAVGLAVVQELREQVPETVRADFVDVCEMGLALLDVIVGYRELIIVDSIQTGKAEPGTLHEFGQDEIKTRRGGSPHFLGVGETLELGKLLELPMPEAVRILAIEVDDPFTLGTELTPSVAAAVPKAVDRLRCWLDMAEAKAELPTGHAR